MSKRYQLPDDERLSALVRTRADNAVDELKAAYGKYIRTIISNIISVPEDREEVENDVYLKLWDCIPEKDPAEMRSVVASVARGLALNRLRSHNSQQERMTEYAASLDELAGYIPADNTVESEFESKLFKQAINTFVRSLPRRSQTIFVQRYYCGDPVDRIASSCGISASLVYKELAKIRAKLKKHLEKEGFTI